MSRLVHSFLDAVVTRLPISLGIGRGKPVASTGNLASLLVVADSNIYQVSTGHRAFRARLWSIFRASGSFQYGDPKVVCVLRLKP